MTIRISSEPIDPSAETLALTRNRRDIGAVVTFSGVCRDTEDNEQIASLTLEHYPGMAEPEISRHIDEANARWPLLGVRIAHRVGRIVPGETIVVVAVASRHRGAAFEAAQFLMDYLKTRAPFWKKVERAAGTRWIDARATDDAAAERWAGARRDAAE